jgi:hypothetical protein
MSEMPALSTHKEKSSKHSITHSRAMSESPVKQGLPDLPDFITPEKCDENKGVGQGRKWTPRKEALLANMWEDEPHLYDSTDREYRDTHKRRDTLLRFSAALNMSGKLLNFIIRYF